jgi:ketosteroid isomerase-like protein
MSNQTLIQNVYESFARGDVPAVLGAMAADITWREAEGNPYQPSGDAWVGPDAVVQNLFAKLGEDWDGFSVHPQKYHASSESVVVEGRYRGTFKATGKAADAQFCHVWGIRGEKIVSFQQYTDTAQFQDAMGTR